MSLHALRACCLSILALSLVACVEDATTRAFVDATMSFIDSSVPELMDAAMVSELDAWSSDTGDACVPAGAVPELSEAVVMHACLHGSDGPFRVVTGSESREAAPDISRAHTLFTVLAVAGSTVHVRYLPSASGDHVLFAARGALIEARQAAASLAIEQRAASCSVLPTSYLVQLTDDAPVELTLRADGASLALVIESLASWGPKSWRRGCDAALAPDAGSVCRKSGPCSSDAECCSYCHDYDHCH